MAKRNQWATGIGFILAAAGSAIGLGNLWKFPYLMGRNGGFWFLIVYLVFILILGLPVMITEMSIGRMTQKSPVSAYRSLGKKATFIGVLGVVVAFIILSYYSVIGGWIIKYITTYFESSIDFLESLVSQVPQQVITIDFNSYIASPIEPVVWHIVFMGLAAILCYKGAKSIEKASKFMMPLLFIFLLIIVVRSVTLPGAMEGLKFVFVPSNDGFTFNSVTAALGQVFYSLSLAMGITVTYGSYLNKKNNIPKDCAVVSGLDTAAAILAGIAIFPAVFAFGLQPEQGPSLIFGTLPQVFDSMTGGTLFGLVFFILMFFAAITSGMALLESVVSFAIDDLHWSRNKAILIVGILITILGIPSALSFGPLSDIIILNYSIFDFMGMVTDNILLPIGGILMCVYIGWFWTPGKLIAEIESSGVKFKLQKAWLWCIRTVTPALILIVTIVGFINVYQTVTAA